MALELNGTTGVSLVQDGVVTAADLSSTLDLTGKTVTLPSGVGGKVLQMQYVNTGSNTTISSPGSWTSLTGANITITPISDSSTIYVLAIYQFEGSANVTGGVRIVNTTSSTVIGGGGGYMNSWDSSLFTRKGESLLGKDTPSSTANQTYDLQALKQNATSDITFGGNGRGLSLLVTEVA
jgi:hypothetical protein